MRSRAEDGPTAAPIAVVLLVLVAVPLAGCTGSTDQQPAGGPGADEGNTTDDGNVTGEEGIGANASVDVEVHPQRLTYAGCTMHQAAVPFPFDQFSSAPEGFEPVAYDPTGTTVELRLTGTFCDNATAATFDVEDVGEFHAYVAVDPPDDHESSDVDRYLLNFGSIVGDEEVQQLRSAWNLGFPEIGSQSMTNTFADGARQGTYSAESDSISVTLQSATAGSGSSLDDRTVRIFGLSNGNVTDVVDWTMANGTLTEGAARGVFQASGTDQDALVGTVAFNALLTGEAWHAFGDDLGFEMVRRDPGTLAG